MWIMNKVWDAKDKRWIVYHERWEEVDVNREIIEEVDESELTEEEIRKYLE